MDDDFDFATPPPEERIIRSHSLTPEQVADFKEAFLLFATSIEDFISMKLLRSLMNTVAHKPEEYELEEYYNEYDPNGTDELYFSDFLHLMSERCKDMTPEDEVILAFRVFDKDDTGFIDENELRHIVTTMGDRMDEDDIVQLILDANSNAEGKIDYREFVAMMSQT